MTVLPFWLSHSGMSSGSGSPWAEQGILLLPVSVVGPKTLAIIWRIFEAESYQNDDFFL